MPMVSGEGRRPAYVEVTTAVAVPGEVRCVHEMIADQCAHCRPKPARPMFVDPVPSPANHGFAGGSLNATGFTAKYSTRCAACREWIDEGDPIAHDPVSGWIHEDCGEEQ